MIIKNHKRGNLHGVFPWSGANYDAICKMSGHFKWEGRAVIFRPTPANVDHIVKHFPEAQWLEDTGKYVKELNERDRIAAEVRAAKALEPVTGETDDHEYKLTPWKHQRKAFLLSRDQEAFALLMEQRTGKTKVTVDTAAYLYKRKRIDRLIVVSVNGVHRNWIDTEVPKHMPDWCPYKAWFSRSSDTRYQRNGFDNLCEYEKGLKIFAFNIEALSYESSHNLEYLLWVLRDAATSLLVIDESTRIKNKGSGRSKFLIQHGRVAAYRRILTGTPYVKDAMDYFGQFYFLDPKILGHDTETSFKKRYCKINVFAKDAQGKFKIVPEDAQGFIKGPRFEKIVGVNNAEELSNLVDGYSYRVLRSECMDLPPKTYKRYPVILSKEQKSLYTELSKEYIAEFKGSTVSAPLAMTRAIRLQQILCNWWPMEENELLAGESWKKVRPISAKNPRMEALRAILEGTDDKVIIWARFRPDLEMIQKELGNECVSYHGGVKDEDKARNYRRFREDKTVRYCAANQASAGLGLDLSVSSTEVYYSNSYDLEHRLQSEDRPEANGKTTSTAVWDLEARGTQDSKIITNLRNKKAIADVINRDPENFFLMEKDEME